MAPKEIMRRIRSRSSGKLFEDFPYLRKKLWGGIYFPSAEAMLWCALNRNEKGNSH